MAAYYSQQPRAMQSYNRHMRPSSNATLIEPSSDMEEASYRRKINNWEARKKSNLRRIVHDDDAISEADSFDSLTSRAQAMSSMLGDSDASSLDSRRFSSDNNSMHSMTTISTEGPMTPTSPLPKYSVEFPDMGGYIDEKATYRMSRAPSYQQEQPKKEMTMSTVGPVGPHLFRSLSMSTTHSHAPSLHIPSPTDERIPSPPRSARSSRHSPASTPIYRSPSQQSEPEPVVFPREHVPGSQIDIEEVRMWTTAQVCQWMYSMDFDDEMVQRFHENDVSGAILVDLKWNDLKELDITSFGKRIELWTEIQHLIAREDAPSPKSPEAEYIRPTARIGRANSVRSQNSPSMAPAQFTQRRGRSGSDASQTSHTQIIREDPEPLPAMEMVQRPQPIEEEEPINTENRERSTSRQPRKQIRKKSTRSVRIPRRPISIASVVIPNEHGAYEEAIVVGPRRQRAPSADAQRRMQALKEKQDAQHEIPAGYKIHQCSKARCPKNGKLVRIKNRPAPVEINNEPMENTIDLGDAMGTILIATTPSIADLDSEQHSRRLSIMREMGQRNSMISSVAGAPSVLASSDVLGHIHTKEVKLQENVLRDVARIDPLDNVRAFLDLQFVQHDGDSRYTSPEVMPAHIQPEVVEIPLSYTPVPRSHTAPPPPPPPPPPRSTVPSYDYRGAEQAQALSNYGISSVPRRLQTPGPLRTTTPFSEADVPYVLSSPPADPRAGASSVPPDLHLRPQRYPTPTMDTLLNGRRRVPTPLNAVDENTETTEWVDEQPTSVNPPKPQRSASSAARQHRARVAPSATSTRTHSGWMKKRKTNWLRHEWPEYHFVLRGTNLAYSKEVSAPEVGSIDMDDYQVACTNSGSNKLAAALKAQKIFGKKGKDGEIGSTVNDYFFQLVPSQEGGKTKKLLHIGKGGKESHFFAVGTRDERIDWMRELMLAKAIKAKSQGFEVEVNGEKM